MLELYHKNEFLKSVTVMEAEKVYLDEIISFKKKHNIDANFFELKKSLLSSQISVIHFIILKETRE
jgi:hypothetical protein